MKNSPSVSAKVLAPAVLDAPSWVNIIPLTDDGRIVFIRQWRHGISDLTLEIPGGMVDPGETPKAAARREMREECGYDSKRIVALGRVHPNPAIQPNWCYTFLALDARPSSNNPEPEPDEETEVVMVAEKQVGDLIVSEKITHALVIAGFALFDLYKRKQRRPG